MTHRSSTASSAQPFVPPNPTLPKLRVAAAQCTGCDLYKNATQTVFGEGPATVRVFLVGEQPGDQEDQQGRPFVGPAGKLLERALTEIGIDRSNVYVTNAVKHFKWRPVGKRSIHQKPTLREVRACRPWLEAEFQVTKPRIVICLGVTAAQAVLGQEVCVNQLRGQVIRTRTKDRPPVVVTVHPSSLLRIPDEEQRRQAYRAFVEDMRKALSETEEPPRRPRKKPTRAKVTMS
jgi:DNA polymerase